MRIADTGKWLLLMLALLALPAHKLKAQYQEMLHPQSEEETALFKKLGVQWETLYMVKDDTRQAASSRFFDEQGRVTRIENYQGILTYSYDDKGRLTAFTDSANTAEGVKVKVYKIEYDSEGRLKKLVTPDGLARFKWDAAKRELSETIQAGDSTNKNIYFYRKDGRLLKADFYAGDGSIARRQNWNYTDNGLLYSFSSSKALKDATDSTVTYLVYNADKKLQTKIVSTYKKWLVAAEGGTTPSHEADFYDRATLKYTYNKLGYMDSEEYNREKDKVAYYYKHLDHSPNGLIEKGFFKQAVGESTFFEHEYGFYQ